MSESLFRNNKSLEARIRKLDSALDIATLLHEMPVADVLRGSVPEPATSQPAMLQKVVEGPDGRQIRISAGSFMGLDSLEAAVRRGEITHDIL